MKKIRQIWDSLFKRPIVKNVTLTSSAKDALIVKHIGDPQEAYTHKALGISDERVNELGRAVRIAFEKYDNTISVAEDVTQMCTHANEFFMVVTIINKTHEERMNPMGGILEGIFKGRRPS